MATDLRLGLANNFPVCVPIALCSALLGGGKGAFIGCLFSFDEETTVTSRSFTSDLNEWKYLSTDVLGTNIESVGNQIIIIIKRPACSK